MIGIAILSLLIFILILGMLLYIRFKGASNFIGQILSIISVIFYAIEDFFQPIFRFLNPYPFQSMLLQFFFFYLIFFCIFITHPLPILKRWPKTTNGVLIGFGVFFFLAMFIQFVVPFVGPIDTRRQRKGFAPNIRHFKQNIGVYGGLLASIFIVILLAIGISYLGTLHTTASWYVMTAAIIALSLAIVFLLWIFLEQFTPIHLTKVSDIISGFISMETLNNIYNSLMKTPAWIYVILAVEISFILAFFAVPLLGNTLYLKDPGNKDYDKIIKMKIKAAKRQLAESKELLKAMKGGIDIDWYNVGRIDNTDLKTQLYDAGYTMVTEPAAAGFVRQNQDKVVAIYKNTQDLADKLKSLKTELQIDKDYSSKQLLRNPIYTDVRTALGTFEDLKVGNDYNYKYTLSAWIFLHNQAPNHSLAYNTFTSLLNYGDKPNILYNSKEQILRVQVKTNTEEKVIFETKDFPLQRWNNIVINYDQGTLDIFINAKLVETIPMIIPDMKFANVFSGAKNGLSGGICNVVYYSGNLSKDRIALFYKLLKQQKFPVFPSPLDDFIGKPWDKIKTTYHLHPILTILGVIGSVVLPIALWQKISIKKKPS